VEAPPRLKTKLKSATIEARNQDLCKRPQAPAELHSATNHSALIAVRKRAIEFLIWNKSAIITPPQSPDQTSSAALVHRGLRKTHGID
jgi:hypothetical protein